MGIVSVSPWPDIRFFKDQLQAFLFEPQVTSTFNLDQSGELMRTIAMNYVYQMFEEVYKATVDGSPKEVVQKLIKLNAPADVGIFSRSNIGHSVYAYAVEDKGSGIYWIKVYDSNTPGTDAYIEVDTKANTWMYFPRDKTPTSDPDDWQGDKKSQLPDLHASFRLRPPTDLPVLQIEQKQFLAAEGGPGATFFYCGIQQHELRNTHRR